MNLTVITRNTPQNQQNQGLFKCLLILLLSVMMSGLAYAVLSLPSRTPGLSVQVADNLEKSGVSNPVTAVLLNYRGYDTLLEMGVLLLALIGVWSLRGPVDRKKERRHSLTVAMRFWSRRHSSPGPVLDLFARLMVPLLILVAGYLLWVGAHAPGGAFQAGSVLGAAGVLLLLSDGHFNHRFSGLSLRVILIAGPGMFMSVGLLLVLLGRPLLEYPPPFAAALILIIEAAATLSIGFTLTALFLGGRPTGQAIIQAKSKEQQ